MKRAAILVALLLAAGCAQSAVIPVGEAPPPAAPADFVLVDKSDRTLTIYSAGVGLLINATKHTQATIYWGHPFVDFHDQKVSLQDYGLHFAISINAF